LLREELREGFGEMDEEAAQPPSSVSLPMRAPAGPRAMAPGLQAPSRAQAGPAHPVSIPTQPRAMAARQEMDERSGGKHKREAEPDRLPRISHRGFVMPEEGPPPKRHRADLGADGHGYGSGYRGGPSHEDPGRAFVKEEE